MAAAGATAALAAPVALGVNALFTGLRGLVTGAQAVSAEEPGEVLFTTALTSAVCAGSAVGAGISALALPVTVPGAAIGGFVLEYFTSVPTIALMSMIGEGCFEHGVALLGLNPKYLKMFGVGSRSTKSVKCAPSAAALNQQCTMALPAAKVPLPPPAVPVQAQTFQQPASVRPQQQATTKQAPSRPLPPQI